MNKYNNSFRKLAWFKLTGENDKNFKHYNLVCSLMGIFFLFTLFGFYHWMETQDLKVLILSHYPVAVPYFYLRYFLKKGPAFAKQLYIESVHLYREFEQQDDTDLTTFICKKRKQFAAERAGWEHFLSD